MKIDGPNSTRSTSKTKKTGKSSGASSGAFAAALMSGADDTAAAENAPAAAPVSGVDALLAMQEVDDATSDKKSSNAKAVRWGEDLLERLDEIRTALLLGTIAPGQLENLSNLLNRQKEAATDPKLIEAIGEIEVRAMVELAKFQRDVR